MIPTGVSEADIAFDRHANLNVMSHEDLSEHRAANYASANHGRRPMTTKIGARRLTH